MRVMVTSNLVFSQWDRIFRDQMATAAAIDRLVHHAVVLEFDVPSYRTDPSRRKSPPPRLGVCAQGNQAGTAKSGKHGGIVKSRGSQIIHRAQITHTLIGNSS